MDWSFLLFVLIAGIAVPFFFKYWNRDKRNAFQHQLSTLKNLTISSSQFNVNSYHVTGDFHGHKLTIDNFSGRTSVILSCDEKYDQPPNDQLTIQKVEDLLSSDRLSVKLKGKIKARPNGQGVLYEQIIGNEVDVEYLQSVLDILLEIGESYSAIVDMGSILIPTLEPLTSSVENGELYPVCNQIIRDIADRSATKWQDQNTSLICPDCLVNFTTHKVRPLLWEPITYYGCRKCHQSKDFLAVEKVIAVLDSQVTATYTKEDNNLRVNWLNFRKLFDFEEVEIVNATDEEIERFAVQIGNDTDEIRQYRYEKMACRVSSECKSSINTTRILQSIFGQVIMSGI